MTVEAVVNRLHAPPLLFALSRTGDARGLRSGCVVDRAAGYVTGGRVVDRAACRGRHEFGARAAATHAGRSQSADNPGEERLNVTASARCSPDGGVASSVTPMDGAQRTDDNDERATRRRR